MFKGQPKGLLASALANMGERFGFYTMMAILVLFLQAKYGLAGESAGIIYATFYALIYILALVGGRIADKTRHYKNTILAGLIIMSVGYFLLAIPTPTPSPNKILYLILTCVGLFVIAFGNGLFKGNLQALVGQMYDNETYSKMRDSGFSVFYMFINIGAFFAPFTAAGVRNWWLSKNGLAYNPDLPKLCHEQIEGTITADGLNRLGELATQVSGKAVDNLTVFAHDYLNVFSTGFNYAFGVAIFAMLLSLIIFVTNKGNLPDAKKLAEQAANNNTPVMDIKEVKQRLYALFAVFGIVIFFWFSFHQNGLTLTYFARDYTLLKIGELKITAEQFQAVNPFFIVLLTPIVLAFFGWLRNRDMEPSTPRKIAIGMFIAAIAFIVMALGSLGLPLKSEVTAMGGLTDAQRVTPFLLIITYFILTVAELFISPLGISFVSKVAPPQYQGIMQGGWLSATALGNQLLFIGAIFYESLPLWMTWSLFVVVCLISMGTMLFMLKWLERVAK